MAQNPDPLDLLIRLFLESEPLHRDTASTLPLDLLTTLGLIAPHADPDLLSGTVMLHPLRELHIVSDRPSPIEGTTSARPTTSCIPP